jgi:hypothetical protein
VQINFSCNDFVSELTKLTKHMEKSHVFFDLTPSMYKNLRSNS